MPIRHFILSTAAILGLATFAGACGDHRAEEFCANLCECLAGASDDEQASCTLDCAGDINSAEEQAGQRILTDECFSCVSHSTCEQFESSCSADCQSLSDALNQPEPEPDPLSGDQ